MALQPHIVQARAQCLRAAIDTRTNAEKPEQILARAATFEAWVLRDNPSRAAQPKGEGTGAAPPAGAGQPQS